MFLILFQAPIGQRQWLFFNQRISGEKLSKKLQKNNSSSPTSTHQVAVTLRLLRPSRRGPLELRRRTKKVNIPPHKSTKKMFSDRLSLGEMITSIHWSVRKWSFPPLVLIGHPWLSRPMGDTGRRTSPEPEPGRSVLAPTGKLGRHEFFGSEKKEMNRENPERNHDFFRFHVNFRMIAWHIRIMNVIYL